MGKVPVRVEKTLDKAIKGYDTNLVSIYGPDPYYEAYLKKQEQKKGRKS